MNRQNACFFLILLLAISPCGLTSENENQAVAVVLDDIHSAAAAADFDRYFKHYAPDSVFFGTDINERWPLEVFKKYTKARFDKGNGWTYQAVSRNIYFSEDRQTAWFDEILHNEKYGNSRGTGVLIIKAGEWKLAQYHLTIPIPNELAYDFVEQILKFEKQQ